MANFQFFSQKNAEKVQWRYNPNGMTEDERWENGNDIECYNYQFVAKNRSVVRGKLEGGKYHGETVAASDYYYYVTCGRGVVTIYGDANGEIEEQTHEIAEGSSFIIAKGTRYNYQAVSQNLEFVLFMENLWDE